MAAVGAVLCACGGARPGPPVPFRLVYTAGTHGYAEPCGCSTMQTGGLARRATILAELTGPRILLDAGGILPPAEHLAYALRKSQTLAYYAAAGYDVASLAADDAAQVEAAAELARSVPLVCLGRESLGAIPVPDYRLVRPQGADRPVLAVFGYGVTSSALSAEALARRLDTQIPAARSQAADAIVVLADATVAGELPDLGAELRVGDLVLAYGGASVTLLSGVEVVGVPRDFGDRVGVIAATPVTRAGGSSTLRWSPPQIIALGAEVAGDEATRDLLVRTADAVVPTLPKPAVLARPAGMAGSPACAGCHASAFATWSASKHATAFTPLVEKGKSTRPDCVPCHTIGFSRSPVLGYVAENVQCETCHGLGADHVSSGGKTLTVLREPRALCGGCHDKAESPEFYFPTYWRTIEHGREAPKAADVP
ncbi:MAG: hypothetical protein HYV63_23605 [Candidatus Schekmanbacteria bacterium]|nr:hypothetical protein [Candidatus Schekmanbacteria bacterium]